MVLDAVGNSAFAEVERLVAKSPVLSNVDEGERISLFHETLTDVFDPGEDGARYRFVGSPGCPACGSTRAERWSHDDQTTSIVTAEATHATWDKATPDERVTIIGNAIERVLESWAEGELRNPGAP